MSSREESRSPRSRFYDGRFYARFIDPFMAGLHDRLAEYVPDGGRVVDVGCGTGSLLCRLAPRVTEGLGVELSPRMAEFAEARFADPGFGHLSVRAGDAVTVLSDLADGYFDCATLVLALHEMPAPARGPLLRELARVSRAVLCLDYRMPMPRNWPGLRNRLAERLAGREHYAAFRDYGRRGGIAGAAENAGLECERVRLVDAGTFEIARLTSPVHPATPGRTRA